MFLRLKMDLFLFKALERFPLSLKIWALNMSGCLSVPDLKLPVPSRSFRMKRPALLMPRLKNIIRIRETKSNGFVFCSSLRFLHYPEKYYRYMYWSLFIINILYFYIVENVFALIIITKWKQKALYLFYAFSNF